MLVISRRHDTEFTFEPIKLGAPCGLYSNNFQKHGVCLKKIFKKEQEIYDTITLPCSWDGEGGTGDNYFAC